MRSDETGASPADPDLLDETPSPGFAEAVAERLGARLPKLGALKLARAEVGMYDMSPDTRAVLDRAPGVDGLYLEAGFSGTGFKKSPAVGRRRQPAQTDCFTAASQAPGSSPTWPASRTSVGRWQNSGHEGSHGRTTSGPRASLPSGRW